MLQHGHLFLDSFRKLNIRLSHAHVAPPPAMPDDTLPGHAVMITLGQIFIHIAVDLHSRCCPSSLPVLMRSRRIGCV